MGGVVKPHGIRGEFCIKSYADSPSIFGRVGSLYLQDGNKNPEPFTVRSWREHKGLILLQVQGVEDRDRAEELRGRVVLVQENDLPELEDGQVYLYQMMGCRVALEDGTDIGVLDSFFESSQQETWVIVNEQKQEILLPAVPEFVLDVDLDAGVITVDPPEGLLDIYLSPEPSRKKSARSSRPSRKGKGKNGGARRGR